MKAATVTEMGHSLCSVGSTLRQMYIQQPQGSSIPLLGGDDEYIKRERTPRSIKVFFSSFKIVSSSQKRRLEIKKTGCWYKCSAFDWRS